MPRKNQKGRVGRERILFAAARTGTPAYRRMVAAVRAWLAEEAPRSDLIDIVAYTPRGVGDPLAAFHADPDQAEPHTRRGCDHCKGDRLARKAGGP